MALTGAALAGCASAVAPSGPAPWEQRRPAPGSQVAVASYYGGSFDGRRTASGERFDEHALTAASREYPLGSVVKVTSLDSGRSVVVRINDRGPYVRGRKLDLSKGAAQKIGLVRRGVGRVRITRLERRRKSSGHLRRRRKRRIRAPALAT